MNYFQKNKKNIIIAVISTLLVASLIAIWLQRKSVNGSENIVAAVFPANLSLGDSLRFEDKTLNAKTKQWDFGDGKVSEKNKGIHMYTKPGFYEVKLTIDNKYTKTFPILVSSVVRPVLAPEESRIDAQTQALQLENVVFRAVAPNAKTFSWRFGESGNIDSKDKMAIYSYKKPGNYTVTLLTDDNPQPIVHQIRILPAYNPNEQLEQDLSSIDDTYSDIDDDIKRTLQQIADGNNFNGNYNYLLKTYFCNNDNTVMIVNNGKPKNYYYYTTGLQFDKNNTIQEVKSTFDNNQKCIIKLEVTQSK